MEKMFSEIFVSKDGMSKFMLNAFLRVAFETITKDIVWYEYEESDIVEQCAVCNIKLITGDCCRISDCTHNFHAECIARYCDRIENRCPTCKTEVLEKIKLPNETQ